MDGLNNTMTRDLPAEEAGSHLGDLDEFKLYANLASEFDVIPRSALPFRSLKTTEIRALVGFLPALEYSRPPSPFVRGNYVAGSILRDLRMRSNIMTPRFHKLKTFFGLPRELILEVFEHLHPIDLYNLIRASKALRELLLDRRMSSTWIEVFQRHPEIPTCPPDISLPKWSSYLFGPSTCDTCGNPEAMIDFIFREHRCQFCMYELPRHFQHHFNGYLDETTTLWGLVRQSHKDDAMIYPTEEDYAIDSTATRYLDSEVDEIGAKMEQYLKAIDDNIPDAKEQYAQFKATTQTSVRESMEHSKTCDIWSSSHYTKLNDRFAESLQLTKERWRGYLVALGYDRKDVGGVDQFVELELPTYRVRRFTKKIFLKFLPHMEPRFKAAKLKRLVDERRQRIENRKKESRTFYDAVRRQLDATTWKQLPCTERIYQITVLSDYINSDNPSEEFPADTAAADIGKLLDSWRTYGKKALFHIMSEHQEPQEAEGFQESDLRLATAVFTCPFHGPNSTDAEVSFGLIGWDDAALHLECNLPWPFHHLCNGDLYFKAKFRFNPNGQHTAQHLLKLMGLNPNTTLASSLDDSSARFACMTCPLERKRRVEGRYVMTFKECVSHAIICSDHQPESFMILTEEATKSVIFHEDISEIRSAHSWCCKHCPEHFNNLVPRQAAVAHVKETHSISSPVEKVDFFYQQSRERLVRRQFFVGSDFPPCYRCNKCPEAKKLRLWTWQTLLAHLTDKHGIPEAIENVDWHQIKFWGGIQA